ncbi:MAG: EF-hand domain-containing protein [Pseudoalteromonas sp.]|uniref:EF-hand domain-containing protein n=1 Tax=unclassified Pseudoalteromonas TaxID=194690 RepID=UPI003F98D8B2
MKIQLLMTSLLIVFSSNTLALDVTQRFNHLDNDKNSYLTYAELEAQPQLLSNYKRWDIDQDNRISLAEFKSYLTKN